MTRDTDDRGVDPLLADLASGDAPHRQSAARALAARDVRGREQAVLDAFDAAGGDDVVQLWIAIALARAGQEVGLEELLFAWRSNPDRAPLLEAYPEPATLAREIQAVLPLAPAATQLLEHHAQTFAGSWIGDVALMLLGRWAPPEQAAAAPDEPPAGERVRRGRRARPPAGGGLDGLEGSLGSVGFGPPDGAGSAEPEPPDDVGVAESEPPGDPEVPAAGAPEGPGVAAEPPQAAPGAAPAAEPEPVLLGGSAPRTVQPGDFFIAQLAAYTPAFEPNARQALEREASGDEIRMNEQTDCRWPVGTRVSVRCQGKGGLIAPAQAESFIWNGQCRTVSFDVEVPADTRPRDAVLIMEVFVHDRDGAPDAVQVAKLRMGVAITAEPPTAAEPPRTVRAQPARTAFASYASADREDVLERVSSIERSAGLKVFVDVVDLRMGDQWNPELEKHILASDRFLLFWSENAAKSRWVKWEREQAVKAKGEDVLELHLLSLTPMELVPEDLRKYHFNDIYLQVRDAERHRRAQREAAAKPGG